MKRTITNNAMKPAGYRALKAPRAKAVAGTASSQGRRPVGDVRTDPRFVRPGGGRPASTIVSRKRTQ